MRALFRKAGGGAGMDRLALKKNGEENFKCSYNYEPGKRILQPTFIATAESGRKLVAGGGFASG